MENVKTIRLMLVDDHVMVRLGITTMLKTIDGMEVVGEAADGESAVQICGEVKPDVVLMDMLLPGISGPEATKSIRERYPATRVIALTSIVENELIREAIDAGAVGYLLKDVSAAELALAIRAVDSGLDALSPTVLRALIQNRVEPSGESEGSLTLREMEVLALLVEGSSNIDIAKKLVVSPTTIKSHVSSILSKLHVTSRTEAAALAVREGLV
jgi:NarL family two-component system response regulator LiaR